MFRDDALKDRVVLITGGGSGLGLSMAQRFVGLGARVFLVGRSQERLDAARATFGNDSVSAGASRGTRNESVATHAADIRDPAAVKGAVAAALLRFGRIDALVNNAAGNFLAATEDLSANAFDAVVRTVLYGTFNMTTEVGRHMIARGGGGVMLNIVTTYAWTGSAFVIPSAVSKAGVLALTRSLAVEWATYGIRLNAIAPGPFPTEGAWQRLLPTPDLVENARSRIPLGRFGEHAELTNLAAFLISDAAPFITGECVAIDGGEWLASGGEFNDFAQQPRDRVKTLLRGLRNL
jgi:NAD(P)-dependent dehydrogenase (short-subunit alcohol dehydrogenase family)